MIVKFAILELYVIKCLEIGKEPTLQGLKEYKGDIH